MNVLHASLLLKNVICPYCKDAMHMGLGSPFRHFDPLELSNNCSQKNCLGFLAELSEKFNDVEKGRTSEAELQHWLEQYKKKE